MAEELSLHFIEGLLHLPQMLTKFQIRDTVKCQIWFEYGRQEKNITNVSVHCFPWRFNGQWPLCGLLVVMPTSYWLLILILRKKYQNNQVPYCQSCSCQPNVYLLIVCTAAMADWISILCVSAAFWSFVWLDCLSHCNICYILNYFHLFYLIHVERVKSYQDYLFLPLLFSHGMPLIMYV